MLQMSDKYEKAGYVIFSVFLINFFLLSIKVYLYLITLSLAVLAYIVDTLLDMINDIIAIYATKMTKKPADKDHAYGHGKYDAFISVIIAMFIIFGALEIVDNLINRLLGKKVEIMFPSSALYVFVFLGFIYTIIGVVEFVLSKKLDISVMEASAFHYLTDPMFTLVVFVGVYLSSIGYIIADYIVSLIVVFMLLYGAIGIIRRQGSILLDVNVIDPSVVKNIIHDRFPEVYDVHKIKSRSDGQKVFLEFHLVLDDKMSLKEAHDICHEVEKYLKNMLQKQNIGNITIHIEPRSSISEG